VKQKPILITSVLVILTLAGCNSPAEVEAARFERADQACQRFGFSPGTPSHAQCMERQVANERARQQMAGAALMEAGGQMMQGQPQARTIAPPMPSQPVQCRSVQRGNQITTQCF
jgi:hypothetical protein